jgi:Lar family restriction alleviation protein
MTALELKPCPFCGGRAVGNENAGNPYVYCESCDVSQTPFDRLTASVTAWNRRSDLHHATERKLAKAVAALEWYAEQTRLCRLIHSEGDSGRHALQADGGEKARAVLAEIERGGV